MKQIKLGLLATMGLLLGMTFTSCQRIDAGHTGVKVNLYGTEKGVDEIAEVTGMVWYNPVTTNVYEVPTYVRTIMYTADDRDESESNEEFRITSKDGLIVKFDVALNYRTERESVPGIFEKYRKPPKELETTILKTFTKDAFNLIASRYTAEELYDMREQFTNEAKEAVRNKLESEGFTVEEVTIMDEIRLPASIKQNIEAKVQAKQLALQKEQEVLQKKYDADKRVKEAEGLAKAMKLKADAERYAYQQKQYALTPLLVQQQWIEKWNGQVPTYSGGTGAGMLMMKDIK